MSIGALVPVQEYLSTSYEPDVEFIEGSLVARNAGELKHGFLQLLIGMALRSRGLIAFTEARLQIRIGRFRIPDVMALSPEQKPDTGYQQAAPYVVVEILSPDDRVSDLNEKLLDYFAKEVRNIWVVDPKTRSVTVHRRGSARTSTDVVETDDGLISLDLSDLFRQMDESGLGA